jgi:hypothetical protein
MGLGSEIRDPEEPIRDPVSRAQKGTGPGSRIRNTAIGSTVLQVQPTVIAMQTVYSGPVRGDQCGEQVEERIGQHHPLRQEPGDTHPGWGQAPLHLHQCLLHRGIS